ncbi:MAG: 23S rRNA (guanosine(2251)-2'-O)-methyltransferase RlmB [Blastocatellia bacterium]
MKNTNYIYGLAPVLESLRAGRRRIDRILIAEGVNMGRMADITAQAKTAGIAVERRTRRLLDDMTHRANHQGVVALLGGENIAAGARQHMDSDTVIDEAFAMTPAPLFVLLDGIEDPRNLGAILRSCECAGAHGVFLPEHRAAGLTDIVAKTSAGAVEHLAIARVTNLVPLMTHLKDRGVWIAGVEGDGETEYHAFDLKGPLAIVMGGEGKGVRRLVREHCDAVLRIPMKGKVNSLNVSVAAGIVLFEALRQRNVA